MTTKKMNGDDKEDGTRQRRRWNTTRYFLGRVCLGRQHESRWMVTTKKMERDNGEDGTRHGIFKGKSAMYGNKKEMDGDDKEDEW